MLCYKQKLHISHQGMNPLCSHIIPLSLVLVLVILLYFMIKLDKIHDYKYILRQYWKSIKQLAGNIQSTIGNQKHVNNSAVSQAKIAVIDLDGNRELGQALSNSDAKRKYSIRLDPSSHSLRRNSIEYTIQVNSIQSHSHHQNHIYHQSQLGQQHLVPPQPQQNQQNNSTPPSNNHLNPCFHTNLQVNTLLPKGQPYQPVKQPTRGGLRHSTDYLKLYREYDKRSRTELVSTKNARSNQNLYQRVSFRDLCEMNGVKTIRDLIKEGA